jgi:hypothetical protein
VIVAFFPPLHPETIAASSIPQSATHLIMTGTSLNKVSRRDAEEKEREKRIFHAKARRRKNKEISFGKLPSDSTQLTCTTDTLQNLSGRIFWGYASDTRDIRRLLSS